jgi:hypothetical protein
VDEQSCEATLRANPTATALVHCVHASRLLLGPRPRRGWHTLLFSTAIRRNFLRYQAWGSHIEGGGSYTPICHFSMDSGCRDRALLVLGSNTAKHTALAVLLDPNTHFRPPLTHTNHHQPALVDLIRFRVSPILTHSRLRRLSTCVSRVSNVSLVGVSLPSADVTVAMVRPEVISQRVFISRGQTRAHWKALVKAHTIVQ